MDYVSAVFETRSDAEAALTRLEALGVTSDQVSVLSTDEARSRHFALTKGTKADEGAATGATIGGLAGAVTAAILSAGAIAIPGLNVVVSGYLISAVAGLGAGAATGGIIGALVGLGFPEHEAKLYEEELKGGNILLAVQPRDSKQKGRIQEVLEDVQDDSSRARRMGRPSYGDDAGIRG